ncbi:hypothetical protein LA080_016435 [Diaporthe eres]|uniref:WW domain-containing protein n=1 Tax=Diaporthe vaccinii TaxID=105482 RepID=A0ABR4EID5_9PEZI|nr:hypothetical protein LA080_016435 [Diaporthe eres]
MPSYEDPPPPYEPGSSSSSQPTPAHTAGVPPQDTNNLTVPLRARNGISPEERRSMEDSVRALPEGWVRQYDPQTHHSFFVDTRATPPRSIWHHPHDDEQYLSSLPDQERERIKGLQRVHSLADIEAESSDDDAPRNHGQAAAASQQQQQQPGLLETGPEKLSGPEKFGRKLKDKLTSSTHQERAAKREKRAEAERQAYYQHQHIRRQVARAVETGEPQLLGRDGQDREVWIEPPQGAPGLRGNPNARLVNPWNTGGYFGGPPGMMAGPGNMYSRPVGPYSRPYGRGGYGYGYGGGLGMAPLLGLGVGLGVGGLMF